MEAGGACSPHPGPRRRALPGARRSAAASRAEEPVAGGRASERRSRSGAPTLVERLWLGLRLSPHLQPRLSIAPSLPLATSQAAAALQPPPKLPPFRRPAGREEPPSTTPSAGWPLRSAAAGIAAWKPSLHEDEGKAWPGAPTRERLARTLAAGLLGALALSAGKVADLTTRPGAGGRLATDFTGPKLWKAAGSRDGGGEGNQGGIFRCVPG